MNFEEINYIVNNKILNDKRIYKAFEPLIISSIKKYYDRADIFEELVYDGKTEIMYAIMEYDASKKVPFNYYLKQRLRFFYLKKNPRRSVSSLNYTNEDGDEVMNLIESVRISNRILRIGWRLKGFMRRCVSFPISNRRLFMRISLEKKARGRFAKN